MNNTTLFPALFFFCLALLFAILYMRSWNRETKLIKSLKDSIKSNGECLDIIRNQRNLIERLAKK